MKKYDEHKLYRALAQAVRKAIDDRGLSLREVSRDADVPVGTLHHWIGTTGNVTNHGRPRFAVVASVAHVLDVDLSTIVAEWASSLKMKGEKPVDVARAGRGKNSKV